MKAQDFIKAMTPRLDQLRQLMTDDPETSARFQRFSEQAMMAKYSGKNLELVFTQREEATYCAGFWEWQALGRKVKKGAKGIGILAPIVVKEKDADEKPILDAEGKPKTIQRFRTVYIFDIADTEPMTDEELERYDRAKEKRENKPAPKRESGIATAVTYR